MPKDKHSKQLRKKASKNRADKVFNKFRETGFTGLAFTKFKALPLEVLRSLMDRFPRQDKLDAFLGNPFPKTYVELTPKVTTKPGNTFCDELKWATIALIRKKSELK